MKKNDVMLFMYESLSTFSRGWLKMIQRFVKQNVHTNTIYDAIVAEGQRITKNLVYYFYYVHGSINYGEIEKKHTTLLKSTECLTFILGG